MLLKFGLLSTFLTMVRNSPKILIKSKKNNNNNENKKIENFWDFLIAKLSKKLKFWKILKFFFLASKVINDFLSLFRSSMKTPLDIVFKYQGIPLLKDLCLRSVIRNLSNSSSVLKFLPQDLQVSNQKILKKSKENNEKIN